MSESLLKKTRGQLVDIILRKDDVHKRAIKQIDELTTKINHQSKTIAALMKTNDTYRKEVELTDIALKECRNALQESKDKCLTYTESNKQLEHDVASYQEEIDDLVEQVVVLKRKKNILIIGLFVLMVIICLMIFG